MDQSEAIARAQQFAQTAYAAEIDNIARDSERKLGEVRAKLASRGLAVSGAMVSETARITAERIKAMVQARLEAIMDGYELHGVSVDDQLAASTINEVLKNMNEMIAGAKATVPTGTPAGVEPFYPQLLSQSIGISAAWIKTQIDRRRLTKKKIEASQSITIYHVQGDNARWNVNSADHSVNVVTKSTEQIFATLRQQIESCVLEGDERKDILEKLTALEAAQKSPSFAQRYTDFIAAAANHVALLAPFIPALTEMLKRVLT